MTTAPVRKSAVAQRLKPAGAAGIRLLVVGLSVGIALSVELTAD